MRMLIDAMPLSAGGGVQVAIAFLENLARQKDEEGAELEWKAVIPQSIASKMPAYLLKDERVIVFTKRNYFDIFKSMLRLSKIVNIFNPDLVFTVFGPAYFRANKIHVVGFALPNLVYERDGALQATAKWWTPLKDAAKRILVRRAHHHIVETDTFARRLAERCNIPADRISVIRNCVNPILDRYSPKPQPTVGPFGILVPAAYYRHKNLEIIPDVAAMLEHRSLGIEFEFQLTLDPEAPQLAAIKKKAASLGVERRIRTLGVLSLEDLARAYQAASAVFLPTLREASTAVYPESFHFERPLITTDLDFARELCGDAALYCKPNDAVSCSENLALLINDRNVKCIRDRLVGAGRARLAECYPRPSEKFEQQITLLRDLASRNR